MTTILEPLASRIATTQNRLQSLLDDFETGLSGRVEAWQAYRRAMEATNPPRPLTLVGGNRRMIAPGVPVPPEIASQFAFMLCVHAMGRSLDEIVSLRVPEDVKDLILDEFNTRCDDGGARQYDRYSLADSDGWNQIASCRLQQLPLGLYVFNIAGIPRSNWFRCPAGEKIALGKFLAFEMRGLAPVFEVHLPRLTKRHITEPEVDASHLRLARIAQLNPKMKGLYSSAWYIDPAVAAIQPRLAFLREFFEQNGGFVHRLGVTASSIADATRKSATRRRLYEEGKYQPTAWARYWPRAAMLRWAKLS